jgi:hypothetical protein
MQEKHPQSLALGLDFAPDFPRIRREHSPIEVNQITDPSHPAVGVEYVESSTLSELVQFLKKYKGQSTKYKRNEIIVLTKQPSVMEKFCADNEIEATIYAWKLG